jgi:hypothetical protein
VTVLPVVTRELRAAARQRSTYWVRLGLAVGAIVVAVVIFVRTFGLPSAQTGRQIFEWLAGIMMVYCLALVLGSHRAFSALPPPTISALHSRFPGLRAPCSGLSGPVTNHE